MMNVSPRFSSQAAPLQGPRPAESRPQPMTAQPLQPQVQFAGRGEGSNIRWGRLSVLAASLLAAVGIGTGSISYDVPNDEKATIKDAQGQVDGYIEGGGDYNGQNVQGMVYKPDSLIPGFHFRMYDLLDDKQVGTVVDGRAYDTDGNLVASTDKQGNIYKHPDGQPEGVQVGKYEAVSQGAVTVTGTVIKNNEGNKVGTSNRKLQNEDYNMSPDNQAAAAVLLGTLDVNTKTAPAPGQQVVNGVPVEQAPGN